MGLKNDRGFALIQVIVAAGILSILSVAISSLIIEQRKSVAYLEDQLEKVQIARNLETVLMDGLSCQLTLQGVQVPLTGSTHINDLKDNSGTVIYQSRSVSNHLQIGQMIVVNDTIAGPSSSGFVDVVIPLSRVRKGGGPSVFKPLEFKVQVVVDASNRVSSCGSVGTQNWVDVTSSRVANTWYTNSTGQTIMVSITSACGSFRVRQTPSSPEVTLGVEVGGGDNLRGVYPIPDTYQYMTTCNPWVWSELR